MPVKQWDAAGELPFMTLCSYIVQYWKIIPLFFFVGIFILIRDSVG